MTEKQLEELRLLKLLPGEINGNIMTPQNDSGFIGMKNALGIDPYFKSGEGQVIKPQTTRPEMNLGANIEAIGKTLGLGSMLMNNVGGYVQAENDRKAKLSALQEQGPSISEAAYIEPMSGVMESLQPAKTYTAKEMGAAGVGKFAGDTLSGAASGFATAGPVGAIIGAAGALGKNILNNISANKAAKNATAIADQQYTDSVNTVVNGRNNYETEANIRKKQNILADGGEMMDTMINNGGSHEENPYGGVPMGMAPDGTENVVEQGEVIKGDYVYSDRLKMPRKFREKYNLKPGTFADGYKEFKERGYENIDGDAIAKRTFEAFTTALQSEQDMAQMKKEVAMASKNSFALGGNLRYAEPFGDLVGLAYNAFDTYRPEQVTAARHAREIGYTPISGNLGLDYIDPVYAMRQQQATAAATTNALANSNSASKRAAILASGLNALNATGNAYRQGIDHNNAVTAQIANFDRATQQMNSQMGLQSMTANAANDNAYRQSLMHQQQYNSAAYDQWKRGSDAAIGQEMSNVFKSVGNMGKEARNFGLVEALARSGVFGGLNDNMQMAVFDKLFEKIS